MKRIALAAMSITAAAAIANAQSAIDAYNLSQTELRGTARFMSMAGAFTALGGDLSTLTQNPGGIGIFRKHELGITVDLNFANSNADGSKWDMTKFYCNNFGYVGAIEIDSDVMPYFQWGASYNRAMSFDRQYRGGWGSIQNSMSNYVASFSNGYSQSTLGQSTSYNPYFDSNADWLSILSYNSYLINPTGRDSDQYQGLLVDEGSKPTTGDSYFDVRERGYVDEYAINFGGNFADVVYWGMGFGITDLQMTQETNYDEELTNARIASRTGENGGTQIGNAYFNLNNYSHTSGTGFNYKIGFIVKPIQEFRIGFAIHTPTYYKLSTSYDSRVDYDYSSGVRGTAYSDYAYYDWKLRTPWKMMVGAAGVIGGSAIISVDYEYQAAKAMRVSSPNGNEYTDITDDIDYYYKPTNTIRVGAEYRLSRNFSVRAGFATTSSGIKDDVNNGEEYVYTSGTNPSYAFTTSTRYITCGVGYRSGGFYADLAYVNKHQKSTYRPYTSYEAQNADGSSDWWYSPYVDFTNSNNNIVLSLGYRF